MKTTFAELSDVTHIHLAKLEDYAVTDDPLIFRPSELSKLFKEIGGHEGWMRIVDLELNQPQL